MIPLRKYSYLGDVNVGFYGIVTDKYAILPENFNQDFYVKRFELRISGINLIGLFSAGNSNGLALPDIVKNEELEILEENKIDHIVLNTNYNCLGNLIAVNDNGGIISPLLRNFKRDLESIYNVDLEVGKIAGLEIVGSCCIATNKGFLVHRDIRDNEMEKLKKCFGVYGDIGSVNFGSPYVRSGILANSHLVVTGEKTSVPEIMRIQEMMCR